MNTRYKKYMGALLILLMSILMVGPVLISICSRGETTSDIVKKEMKKYFDTIVPESCVIEKVCDTYSGPPYEGIRLYTIEYYDEEVQNFITEKEGIWNPMPFTEDLQTIMYGGIKDGIHYEYNLAGESGMPLISNGIWKMIGANQEHLLEASSFDFKLSVLDLDTNILYYFEINT